MSKQPEKGPEGEERLRRELLKSKHCVRRLGSRRDPGVLEDFDVIGEESVHAGQGGGEGRAEGCLGTSTAEGTETQKVSPIQGHRQVVQDLLNCSLMASPPPSPDPPARTAAKVKSNFKRHFEMQRL